ncbi:MAG TPA: DNA-3-methyladenine glycosylase, partial [Candidatus Tumulicola sp.]|nr:DNA-3-methyladenine glycosylase [Candidatus Tumulicola sp.]
NLSSEADGRGAGVLVRALEPLEGMDVMRRRRGAEALRDLCRGPGRLCRALNIDRSLDGTDPLRHAGLWLAARPEHPRRIRTSRRIGVSRAAARALRFYEAGNRFVSGPAGLSPP